MSGLQGGQEQRKGEGDHGMSFLEIFGLFSICFWALMVLLIMAKAFVQFCIRLHRRQIQREKRRRVIGSSSASGYR
jgi:hypothetical protein